MLRILRPMMTFSNFKLALVAPKYTKKSAIFSLSFRYKIVRFLRSKVWKDHSAKVCWMALASCVLASRNSKWYLPLVSLSARSLEPSGITTEPLATNNPCIKARLQQSLVGKISSRRLLICIVPSSSRYTSPNFSPMLPKNSQLYTASPLTFKLELSISAEMPRVDSARCLQKVSIS